MSRTVHDSIVMVVTQKLGHYPATANENWLVHVALANAVLILACGGNTPQERCERAAAEVTRLCDIHSAGSKVEIMSLPVSA